MEEEAVYGGEAAGEPEAEAGELPVGGLVEALAVGDAREDDGAATVGEVDGLGVAEGEVLDKVSWRYAEGPGKGPIKGNVRLRSRMLCYPDRLRRRSSP